MRVSDDREAEVDAFARSQLEALSPGDRGHFLRTPNVNRQRGPPVVVVGRGPPATRTGGNENTIRSPMAGDFDPEPVEDLPSVPALLGAPGGSRLLHPPG